MKDNLILGACLYGDTTDSSWYFQLMTEETNISDFRDSILFGQVHLDDSVQSEAADKISQKMMLLLLR